MNSNFLSLDINSRNIFRQEKKSSYHTIVNIFNSLLIDNFNKNISWFCQILSKALQKLSLVLLHMHKRTVSLQPLSSSLTSIIYSYRLCTMEYDCHVLVKIRKIVNRFSIELFLVQQEQRQERLYLRQLFHKRNAVIPLFKYLPPIVVTLITKENKVRSSKSKYKFKLILVLQKLLINVEFSYVRRFQPTQYLRYLLVHSQSSRFLPQL